MRVTALALRLSADPAVVLRLAAERRGLPVIEPIAAMAAQLATPVEVGVGLTLGTYRIVSGSSVVVTRQLARASSAGSTW